MEFSFSDEPKKGSAPATKVYSPKRKPAKAAESASKSRSRVKDRAAESEPVRRERRPITPASRIGIMFSGFLLAGMVIFTLTGYERISRAHADINTINNAIEESKLRIKALDVQIECAVTIQDAQDTAIAYGMRYPVQSQYLRVGDRLPVSGMAPAGLGPGETVAPAGPVAPTDPDAPTEDAPSDD